VHLCISTRKPDSGTEWHEAIERFATPPDHIKKSQGRKNLVPAPSHTTSGETLVCIPRIVADRAGSAGFVQLKHFQTWVKPQQANTEWWNRILEWWVKGLHIRIRILIQVNIWKSIRGFVKTNSRIHASLVKQSSIWFLHHGMLNTRGPYHGIGP